MRANIIVVLDGDAATPDGIAATVSVRGTRALNEALAALMGEQVVLVGAGAILPPAWDESLLAFASPDVGAVVARPCRARDGPGNRFRGPTHGLVALSLPAVQETGLLDEELDPWDGFGEYLIRLLDHSWGIRFVPLEGFFPHPGTVDPDRRAAATRRVILKLMEPCVEEIPEAFLDEIPALASRCYRNGNLFEALRWISRLAARALPAARAWWAATLGEPPLEADMFRELAAYLDDTGVVSRTMALSRMRLEQGDLAAAVSMITGTLDPRRCDPEPYYLLGEIARRRRFLEDARLFYEHALRHDPSYSDARERLNQLEIRP